MIILILLLNYIIAEILVYLKKSDKLYMLYIITVILTTLAYYEIIPSKLMLSENFSVQIYFTIIILLISMIIKSISPSIKSEPNNRLQTLSLVVLALNNIWLVVTFSSALLFYEIVLRNTETGKLIKNKAQLLISLLIFMPIVNHFFAHYTWVSALYFLSMYILFFNGMSRNSSYHWLSMIVLTAYVGGGIYSIPLLALPLVLLLMHYLNLLNLLHEKSKNRVLTTLKLYFQQKEISKSPEKVFLVKEDGIANLVQAKKHYTDVKIEFTIWALVLAFIVMIIKFKGVLV
jgi:hypothetical protein